jgi:hypothetical protein
MSVAKNSETAASVAAVGGLRFDRRSLHGSRLDPAALAAAAAADEIPVQGKWRPGASLLFVVFASVLLWGGLVAVGVALVR